MNTEEKRFCHTKLNKIINQLIIYGGVICFVAIIFWIFVVEGAIHSPEWTRTIGVVLGISGILILLCVVFLSLCSSFFRFLDNLLGDLDDC